MKIPVDDIWQMGLMKDLETRLSPIRWETPHVRAQATEVARDTALTTDAARSFKRAVDTANSLGDGNTQVFSAADAELLHSAAKEFRRTLGGEREKFDWSQNGGLDEAVSSVASALKLQLREKLMGPVDTVEEFKQKLETDYPLRASIVQVARDRVNWNGGSGPEWLGVSKFGKGFFEVRIRLVVGSPFGREVHDCSVFVDRYGYIADPAKIPADWPEQGANAQPASTPLASPKETSSSRHDNSYSSVLSRWFRG